MKTRSLSSRVALFLGTATVLLLGAAALLMDHMVDAEMQQRFDADLLAQAQALSALVETGPRGLYLDADGDMPAHMLAGGRSHGGYALACTNGGRLRSQPAPTRYPAGWTRSVGEQPVFADVPVGHAIWRAVWFRFALSAEHGDDDQTALARSPANQTTCRIVFMRSRDRLDDILWTIDGILLVTPLLALLLVLLLSPFLVRQGLRPLAVLGEKMRTIGPRAPGKRLTVTGTRELDPLVTQFNEVLARMDEGVARERRFTDALAHETRTRLAELRSLIDVERRYPGQRPLHALLDEVGDIGGELEAIVSSLLLLTRLDAGLEKMQRSRVALGDFLARHIERRSDVLERHALRIDSEHPAHSVIWTVDPALLDIVVGNLLDNACEYAPPESRIRLRWNDDFLEIANPAPDLDQKDVVWLGQRFWSKQQGRAGHTGIGLALAGSASAAMGFRLVFSMHEAGVLQALLERGSDASALRTGTPVPPGNHPEASPE